MNNPLFSLSENITYFRYDSVALKVACALITEFVRNEKSPFLINLKRCVEKKLSFCCDDDLKEPNILFDLQKANQYVANNVLTINVTEDNSVAKLLSSCTRTKPNAVILNPILLFQIAKYEKDSDDSKVLKSKAVEEILLSCEKLKVSQAAKQYSNAFDADCPETWLHDMSQDQLKHSLLLFAKILHELSHILHYECYQQFSDMVQAGFLVNQKVDAPPRVYQNVLHTDIGNIMEVMHFGGIVYPFSHNNDKLFGVESVFVLCECASPETDITKAKKISHDLCDYFSRMLKGEDVALELTALDESDRIVVANTGVATIGTSSITINREACHSMTFGKKTWAALMPKGYDFAAAERKAKQIKLEKRS